MNVHQFVLKWTRVSLTERSASQQHFLDLCEIFGHGKPADLDPDGDFFTFEKGAAKYGGGSGWADVWKRGFFAWEYKRQHADLAAAYDQLLRYREALENPPLLVVCDMDRFVIHTNFTGRPAIVHEIPLRELAKPENLEIVRAAFHDPEKLKPGVTREGITQEAANRVAAVAQSMRARDLAALEVAKFLDRFVFALFAQSVDLLPERVVTRLLRSSRDKPELFHKLVSQLFGEMAQGGFFGADEIRHFDGNLFVDDSTLLPTRGELEELYKVARLDWSAIDPSILGTLFERGMDPDKRSQLGAHYTSREDIETLVEPVVMQPLRREWEEVKRVFEEVLATGKKDPTERDRAKVPFGGLTGSALRKAREEASLVLRRFWERLGHVKILDPACGSGNFLYVTLQKLKDLEKEVILYGMDRGNPGFPPLVGPWQLYGIEVSPYAFELAQMSVWIGYLQWSRNNGFGQPDDPVLRPMHSFECRDAVLDLSDPECPREPEWPAVDFIVGNPPFLGNKLMRSILGSDYVESLWSLYGKRLPATSDFCCYWFEKARAHVESGKCRQAGLLATAKIKQISSRRVLERIKETADLFFAISDREWVLDGAAVRTSMVGFGRAGAAEPILDGKSVKEISSKLSAGADAPPPARLAANLRRCFMGTTKVGAFDIEEQVAIRMLGTSNPNGRPCSDVLRPFCNGSDLVRSRTNRWVIDFGVATDESAAALYEVPFEYLRHHVQPDRVQNHRPTRARHWWLLGETLPALRGELRSLDRYVGTPRVSRHRVFAWLDSVILPDSKVIAIAAESDEILGIVQSRVHTLWTLEYCGWHGKGNDPTYNPTTVFETFPFPQPSPEQEAAIAAAAKELDDLRSRWLNPPEWTREEVLEFPGSVGGPWKRYLHDPDSRGIGTVRFPRLVPRDDEAAATLKRRTLTNLYNQRPTWLDLAHRKLDEAVFAAYEWDPGLSDTEVLSRLLALNLERAGQSPT